MSTSANRQAMITFAEQFLGHPYVWGGTDLLNGCDCSGFTQVYAALALQFPDALMNRPRRDENPGH